MSLGVENTLEIFLQELKSRQERTTAATREPASKEKNVESWQVHLSLGPGLRESPKVSKQPGIQGSTCLFPLRLRAAVPGDMLPEQGPGWMGKELFFK